MLGHSLFSVKPWFLVSMLLMASGGCAGGSSPASVLSSDKSGALNKLATWKAQGEGAAADAAVTDQATVAKYNSARTAVEGDIRAFEAQVADVASRMFGTVDLSEGKLNPRTEKAVTELTAGHAGRNMALDVAGFLLEQYKADRRASADALKAKLEELRWRKWEDVHGSPPR